MLRDAFSLKYISMTTDNFWTCCGLESCRIIFVYGINIQDIKKRVVKTSVNISLTVKMEWSNVGAPKNFFHYFKI